MKISRLRMDPARRKRSRRLAIALVIGNLIYLTAIYFAARSESWSLFVPGAFCCLIPPLSAVKRRARIENLASFPLVVDQYQVSVQPWVTGAPCVSDAGILIFDSGWLVFIGNSSAFHVKPSDFRSKQQLELPLGVTIYLRLDPIKNLPAGAETWIKGAGKFHDQFDMWMVGPDPDGESVFPALEPATDIWTFCFSQLTILGSLLAFLIAMRSLMHHPDLLPVMSVFCAAFLIQIPGSMVQVQWWRKIKRLVNRALERGELTFVDSEVITPPVVPAATSEAPTERIRL